jgi:hypothetical protein
MKLRLLLPLLLALAPLLQAENEIGFIEKFALAADREKVLGELIPGSEDYYFFHALHYQNTGQKAKLTAVLEQWAARFEHSERRKIIENRAALLGYETDPQATLKFLRERLNLQFNHVQEARDQKPDLPTALDPARVAREIFVKEALRHDDLGMLSLPALEQLVRDKTPLRPAQRRALLSRLDRPDLTGLVPIIAEELRTQESGGFGSFEIHRALLPEQLDELAKLVPALVEQQVFVFTKLRKLAPGADADVEFDPIEREAWLERAWSYTKTLSPTFNSLKAAVLHRRLQHDRGRGIYDKARFLEYLKLPRPVGYMNPKYLEQPRLAGQAVDLNADVGEALTGTAAIGNDEPLVRDYLLHLLVEEPAWEPWAVWLRDTWLKPIFAEAKIVAGVGDPEKWASLLTPSAFQTLKDRVDIDFSPNNAPFIPPADEVSVTVFLKNTPRLIVKIYEINALNFFLTQKRELNTDLKLDGLVAHTERTHTWDDAAGTSPFRRASRTFNFPELGKGQRGAWVIEFIGGGKSSRALIRKGQWHLIQQTGPAGDLLTVLDENYVPVKDAVAWLDGRKFVPQAAGLRNREQTSGLLYVPFTAQPGSKQIVLSDPTGTFATLTNFEHHAEEYQLDAHFHIEREQLLARREATLAVRTSLLLGEAPLPLELLKDTKLAITSTTHDGVSTTREFKTPALAANKVFTQKISVSDRLATLSVVLSGKIDSLSRGGEKQDLTAQASWQINGIDTTEATNDTHLSRFDKDGYVFELLGKNGEPLADQQVVFELRHRDIDHNLTIPLRTDDRGRVALGALTGLATIGAKASNGRSGHWSLQTEFRAGTDTIHALAGEVLRVPYTGEIGAASLLERRGETFTRNFSHTIAAVPGFLEIKGLTPGDYSLRLGGADARELSISVTAGKLMRNWLLSSHRFLESRGAAPLQIESIATTAEAITVKVANANAFTRVHVAATRFLPGEGIFGGLGDFTRFGPASAVPAKLPNLYAGGRQIGDEYRYILERRYSKLFPGNLLTRPGLLLNPWEKRSTEVDATHTSAGQVATSTAGGRTALARKASAENAAAPHPSQPSGAAGANLDFLANIAPVLYNLVPDKDGLVRIDRKALGDRQHVQIYAEDLANAVWQTVALPEAATKFEDLRLTRNLDPAKPFAEKKEVTVLANGKTLSLADILTSELETYDTLGGIFSLFTTLSGNTTLAKFAWVLEWPKLKDEEKRAKYSEFACHELSFFLSRKDPEFFTAVVQPYLRNKKDKTFMDEYLLGGDLRRSLEPWQFARLNGAERCLLAQRLPGEAEATARHLRELWELLPPDPDRQNHLFETALRGRTMQAGEGGFAGAKAKAEASSRSEALGRLKELNAPATPALAMPAPAAKAMRARGVSAEINSAGRDVASPEIPRESKAFGGEALKDLAELETRAGALFQSVDEVQLQRAAIRAYYRQLGPTKEWAENNYYRLPIGEQNASLITINAFWRDYAAWDGKAPFLSANVAEASRNFAEMMLALAVLDLPFDAPKHTTKSEGGAYSLTAGGPIIAYHQEIKPAAPAPQNTELLVSQNFYRHGDRYRMEGNEKFDKYVTDEFLAGATYGANVVVTNPTSSPQKLELLLQIPQGALPVLKSRATASPQLRLEPYTTQTFEYFFYFPAATKPGATFAHYPVQVSRSEQIVGAAKAFTFKVVPRLTQFDKASWDYVSQYGTEAEVFAFLEQNNIARLNLERVAWRARQSVDFFRKLIALLEKRHTWSEPLYRYAVVHNDAAPLREWVQHRDDFLAQCGPRLEAKLVQIDPLERRTYEHLEYSPLVNQRAHRLGAGNKIANPVLRGQYQALLTSLAHQATLDPVDQVSVVYYLFLQDRVEEALARLHTIQPEQLATRLQLDYLRCYAALYESQPAEARGIAVQYANHPVDRWRKLFAEVTAQLDEIEGKAVTRPGDDVPNREQQQSALTATEPSFDFKVENRSIALTWKNLGEVAINYYLMDPEFSFSSSPFVSQDASRFAVIKPNKSATQALPAGRDALDVPLPAEYARANVLVEIVAAGQRKAQAYHANTLKLILAENYGRLDVRDAGTDKPVSRSYVKVFARLHGGTVRFFKDGYTDLRGRFDYASLNSSEQVRPLPEPGPTSASGSLDYQMLRPGELNRVEKLAILVLSEANGALVREVAPPSE